MTPADCIRAAIPGASDETCQHIVWGRTPFPFKKLTARDFYKAASRLQRAANNGIRLCDWCDNIAVDGWCCQSCNDALRQPHPNDTPAPIPQHQSTHPSHDPSGVISEPKGNSEMPGRRPRDTTQEKT